MEIEKTNWKDDNGVHFVSQAKRESTRIARSQRRAGKPHELCALGGKSSVQTFDRNMTAYYAIRSNWCGELERWHRCWSWDGNRAVHESRCSAAEPSNARVATWIIRSSGELRKTLRTTQEWRREGTCFHKLPVIVTINIQYRCINFNIVKTWKHDVKKWLQNFETTEISFKDQRRVHG